MYISNVKIRNFRSLKSVDIEFHPGKNVIVGKNNSGKSNIIKALDVVLGEKYPTYYNVKREDFHATLINGDEKYEDSFTILVELKHGSDSHDYNKEELLKYRKKCGVINLNHPIFNENSNDIDDDFLYSDEKYNQNVAKGKINWYNPEDISSLIDDSDSVSIYIHVKNNGGELDKFFGIIIKLDDDEFKFIYTVNKFLRDAIITSAIIPAVRSPYLNLKINNYSWYSKMLKELWDSTIYESKNKLMKLNSDIQLLANEALKPATSIITSQVSNTINASSVDFYLMSNNADELYNNAKIYVNDSGFETILENKGTGTQSCVIISLFAHYCKTMHKSGSLLAIEEPECYLHPHARRSLSSSLDSFIFNDSNNIKPDNQIIITTHSSDFLKGTKIENLHILRKDDNGLSTVKSVNPNDTNIKEYRQKVEKIINSKNSELFFADCVILVEGGEEHIMPLIADLLRDDNTSDNPLDRYNISIINVNGKSNFRVYIKLLEKLEINYYVIADFDYLYGGKEIRQLKSDKDKWKINGGSINRNILLDSNSDIIKSCSEVDESKLVTRIKDPKNFDAIRMYSILDYVCNNDVVTDDLRELFGYLKSKFVKEKINYQFLKEKMSKKHFNDLNDILDKLYSEEHIYILKKGELEDYYLYEALKIPGGKEVRAIGIADAVYNNLERDGNTIEKYLDISEYKSVIQKAIDDCKGKL